MAFGAPAGLPALALLGFAAWTLTLLASTIGVYRWARILSRRQRIGEFGSGGPDGPPWYRRAVRAHANCLESLPLFMVVVFVLDVNRISGPAIDIMCVVVLFARIWQSVVHVAFVQTDIVVSLRFFFFLCQVVSLFGLMAAAVAWWL